MKNSLGNFRDLESKTVAAIRVAAMNPIRTRYGPNTEIQYRPLKIDGFPETDQKIQSRLPGQCRSLSKRKADTEIQYRHHIAWGARSPPLGPSLCTRLRPKIRKSEINKNGASEMILRASTTPAQMTNHRKGKPGKLFL